MNSEQTLGQYLSILDEWKNGDKALCQLPIPLQNRIRKAAAFDKAGMFGTNFACLSLRAAEAMLRNGLVTKAQVRSVDLQKLPGIGPKIAEELKRWAAE